MTLIAITAPSSGPIATRQGDLVIPGTEIAYGGFSSLLGYLSTDAIGDPSASERDVYLLGMTRTGLQLARVGLDDLHAFDKYTFFNPKTRSFSTSPPPLEVSDSTQIYLPGTFSSGSVFYSPYFSTFIMIYFNKMVDSTFYIRYLNLEDPLVDDEIWIMGGKNGNGIGPEDAEALVKYPWSREQKLYASPPGKGGFNYAGMAHPEYFNRQYFANSLYPDSILDDERRNNWYGSDLIPEENTRPDGKHLLLSWTSQVQEKGNPGIYEVQLAMVEFDDIPVRPGEEDISTMTNDPRARTTRMTGPQSTSVQEPDDRYDGLPKGYRGDSDAISSFLGPVTAERVGAWNLLCNALIWLCIIAIGALVV
jgi:hypothetical protein